MQKDKKKTFGRFNFHALLSPNPQVCQDWVLGDIWVYFLLFLQQPIPNCAFWDFNLFDLYFIFFLALNSHDASCWVSLHFIWIVWLVAYLLSHPCPMISLTQVHCSCSVINHFKVSNSWNLRKEAQNMCLTLLIN